MPKLDWPSKRQPVETGSSSLSLDSLVYPGGAGYPTAPASNHLILGDNLAVMSALMAEYEGAINLIYADPPFFTNRSYQARVGRGEDSRKPQHWQLAEGYPDSWNDLDDYLDMLYPRLVMMHRLLAENGSLYLHLDWHANAYARILLDEIFGAERLLNEIVWVYHGPSPIRSAFNRKHDTILAYTKGKGYTFNVDAVRQPYDPATVRTFASSSKAGFGKIPDLERGKVPEDWWYFPVVARLHNERSGYPTQKPQALIERVILASSNPGDLVADFFCGSGTLPLAAAGLGRRFIASDVAWRAVHTARARLVGGGAPAFTLKTVQDRPISYVRLPGSQVKVLGNELQLHLPDSLNEMDYWEADPNWDGQVFRSVAQVQRPRKLTPLPAKAALPLKPDPDRVCVRIVAVDGQGYLVRAGD